MVNRNWHRETACLHSGKPPLISNSLIVFPVVNRIVVKFSFERLALSYDTARGFIQAQEEIARHVPELAPG